MQVVATDFICSRSCIILVTAVASHNFYRTYQFNVCLSESMHQPAEAKRYVIHVEDKMPDISHDDHKS